MRLINYVLVIVPLESLLTISNRYQIKMWRSISRKIITSFIPITRIFCDSYEIEKCSFTLIIPIISIATSFGACQNSKGPAC